VTANYLITGTEYIILCNAAGNGAPGVTITLPAVASNAGGYSA
jgi:hypothetical protein